MKMNWKNIGTVATVVGIAIVGFFLFPLVAAYSITLFPISGSSPHFLIRMTMLIHVLPGLVVGAILGLTAGWISPIRRFWVLLLPAIVVFLSYLMMNLTIFPISWNARFLLTFFIPEWGAFFVGAATTSIIAVKLRTSNTALHGTGCARP